jgi:hypothetical protein
MKYEKQVFYFRRCDTLKQEANTPQFMVSEDLLFEILSPGLINSFCFSPILLILCCRNQQNSLLFFCHWSTPNIFAPIGPTIPRKLSKE